MERIRSEKSDFILLLLLILVSGVGLTLLFSGSYVFSARSFQDPFYLVKRQLLFLGIGTVAALALSVIPLTAFRSLMPVILTVSLLLCLLPFIPGLGILVLGSRRWINLFGLSFQPAELMKLTLVLYLAYYFSKPERGRTMNELIPPFVTTVLSAGIIYIQNDYSTAVFVLIIGLAMMFMARVRLLHFFLLSLFALPASFFLLFTKEHRVQRLLTFLDVGFDKAGNAYQIANSQSAFVAGGLWGKGLGRSTAKLGSLPMSYSDFIYAVIGEETGLLGALFVLALFAGIAWRGYRIAAASEDPLCRYLAFGITTTIVLQALLNMTVAVGLVPTTGVTLPFFSAGGSSLALTLAMCGILYNVAKSGGRMRERGSDV
jgi:cell division protein FtsW